MGDDKSKPIDDLKQGLGLLFRAAKGAVEKLPTEKIEDVAKDAAKEMGRAFETIGGELDKAWKATTGSRPSHGAAPQDPSADASGVPPVTDAPPPEAKADGAGDEKATYDDAYAPEPPKGPRIG